MHVLRFIASVLIGLVIFLGIPLLTWVGDFNRFFADPGRMSYGIIIVCLQVFAAFYLPESLKRNSKRTADKQRKNLDLALIQLFCMSIIVVAPLTERWNAAVIAVEEIALLGAGLVFIGFLMMQVAEKALDRLFSVEVILQEGHQLVTNGPFTYVRHPRYLGITVFFMGIALVFRSWVGLVLTMALFLVLLYRIQREEAMLADSFGQEWESYCEKSWRILPFIY